MSDEESPEIFGETACHIYYSSLLILPLTQLQLDYSFNTFIRLSCIASRKSIAYLELNRHIDLSGSLGGQLDKLVTTDNFYPFPKQRYQRYKSLLNSLCKYTLPIHHFLVQ